MVTECYSGDKCRKYTARFGEMSAAAILLFMLVLPRPAAAASFTYLNTTAGDIDAGVSCAGAARLVRAINVTDTFFVDDLDVGFIATHDWRGDINATLTSPAGTSVQFTPVQLGFAGRHDDYNVEFDDESANPANDGDDDNVLVAPYERIAAPTNAFAAYDGENANGNWTLSICDAFPGDDDGQLTRFELLFTSRDDFGDAPNTYLTTAAAGGPQHVIHPGLNIGAAVNHEADGTPDPAAAADGGDDGTSFNAIGDNTTSVSLGVTVTNNTGSTANLIAWIDFDQSGTFDAGEVSTTATVATGSTGVIAGVSWTSLNLGGIDCTQDTFARVRLTTFAIGGANAGGLFNDGEVEDYQVPVDCVAAQTPVFVTDLNAYSSAGQTRVEFTTAGEVGAVGLRVERELPDGRFHPVHRQPWIHALADMPQGGRYTVTDSGAVPGQSYRYRIVELDHWGQEHIHGPYVAEVFGGRPAGVEDMPAADLSRTARWDQPMLDALQRAPKNAGTGMGARLMSASDAAQPHTAGGALLPLKLRVLETGIYYLSAADLGGYWGVRSARVQRWLDRGLVKLTLQGDSVRWHSDGDGLYFFGQALAKNGGDRLYEDANVYRLEPRRRGKTMAVLGIDGAEPGAGGEFTAVESAEQDVAAYLYAASKEEEDYWVWRSLAAGASGGRDRTHFDLQLPARQIGPGHLVLRLYGLTSDSHRVRVLLNGRSLAGKRFSGLGASRISRPIPADLWSESGNTLEVIALPNDAAQISAIGVDGYDIYYPRSYADAGAALNYTVQSADQATSISGFASAPVATFKVDRPSQPEWVEGGLVSSETYSGALPEGDYWTVTATGLLSPAAVTLDYASDLKGTGQKADYLIITTDALLDGAGRLAQYRSSAAGGRYRTQVVLLEDIYDQFSHSQPRPSAIRSFIETTQRSWRVRPRFIVLLGDGSFDYRGRVVDGYNLVPPLMQLVESGLHAADNRYADRDGDGLPEVALGRIPAKFNQQVLDYLDKLVDYESGTSAPRVNNINAVHLLLADNPDKGGNFPQSAATIASRVFGTASQIDLLSQDVDTSRAQLFDALRSGVDVVQYLGHGGVDRMASEGWLLASDAQALGNRSYPIMTGLSCLIGRYTLPGFDSLGEELVLAPNSGMVAVWSTTGMSYNSEVTPLGRAFQARLRPGAKLGRAILSALAAEGRNGDSALLYTLLGDPALVVSFQ